MQLQQQIEALHVKLAQALSQARNEGTQSSAPKAAAARGKKQGATRSSANNRTATSARATKPARGNTAARANTNARAAKNTTATTTASKGNKRNAPAAKKQAAPTRRGRAADRRRGPSPLKGRKRASSPSGPLAPAVVKILKSKRQAMNVRHILDELVANGYKFNSPEPKKNLAARIYRLKGVKQVGEGLFGLA